MTIHRAPRSLVLPAVLFLAQTPETLTPADRQAGIAHLESSRKAVLHAVAGLSSTQWNSRWTPARALDQFRSRRQASIDFLKSAKGRDHTSPSPFGQPIEPYQWLLFLSAHSGRHLKQINEVLLSPAFPKT